MCIPRKINFLQLGRYGRRKKQRYRQTFRKDFAYNASLAAVNITKVWRKQTGSPFSIGQIKSLMVNAHFINRFFELSGIDPYKTLNAKLVKEPLALRQMPFSLISKVLTNY